MIERRVNHMIESQVFQNVTNQWTPTVFIQVRLATKWFGWLALSQLKAF